jgi:hypothetical protein
LTTFSKAKVEVGVQIALRWIIAKLRKRTFFTLAEANAAIRDCVEQINNRVTRHLGASRRSLFEQIERSALKKLPGTEYVFAQWKQCRAGIDNHVEIERHYDEAIEDRIGVGGLADEVVPGFDGELAGEQRGAASMAFLHDLHEIAPLASIEAVRTEVVEDQQIDFGQQAEEAREAAVAVRELQLCEEARHARVVCAVALAAGPLSKGAGEPGLAQSTFSGNEKIAFLLRVSWVSIDPQSINGWPSIGVADGGH